MGFAPSITSGGPSTKVQKEEKRLSLYDLLLLIQMLEKMLLKKEQL
jgi:hypothetical protein